MSPTRTTPEQRSAKLDAAHRQLVDAVASVASSEGWLHYLAAMHRFHDYSATNVMMILFQRPDAQRVAGYRTWPALGRQVVKGAQGIAIWAPCARRVEREDETTGESVTARALSGFRLVHVFDVADTEGEPLPENPCQATLLTGEAPDGMWAHRSAHPPGPEKVTLRVGSLGTTPQSIRPTTAPSRVTQWRDYTGESDPCQALLGRDEPPLVLPATTAQLSAGGVRVISSC
jgi:hypothetical protein